MIKGFHSIYLFIHLLIFLILGSGCSTPPIHSTYNTNYQHSISRLYVLIDENPQLKQKYFQAAATSFEQALSLNNIPSMVRIKKQLVLDDSIYEKEIASYKPDGILMIQPDGSMKDEFGFLMYINWNAALTKPGSNEVIWKTYITTKDCEAFAVDIIQKLIEDGMFNPKIVQSFQ